MQPNLTLRLHMAGDLNPRETLSEVLGVQMRSKVCRIVSNVFRPDLYNPHYITNQHMEQYLIQLLVDKVYCDVYLLPVYYILYFLSSHSSLS